MAVTVICYGGNTGTGAFMWLLKAGVGTRQTQLTGTLARAPVQRGKKIRQQGEMISEERNEINIPAQADVHHVLIL